MVSAQKIYEESSVASSVSSARRTPLRMRSLVAGFVYGFVMELTFIASNGYIQAIFTEEDSDSLASRPVNFDIADAAGGQMFSLNGNNHATSAVPLGDTPMSTIINYDYDNTILDSGSVSNNGDSSGRSSSVSNSLPDNLFGLYSQNLMLLFFILLVVALWRQHREYRREEVQLAKERQRRRRENHNHSDGMNAATARTTTTPKGSYQFCWSMATALSTIWTMGLLLGMIIAFGIITCLPSSMLRKDFCFCWLSYILGICMLLTGFLTAYECQSIFVRHFFPLSSSGDGEDHDDMETETELDLELTDDDDDDDDDGDVKSCTSRSVDYKQLPHQQQDSTASLHRCEGTGLACPYVLLSHVV